MSFDRNTFPAHGWTFYQRETKWNAPQPTVDDFDTTVNRIRNHRLANLGYRLTTDRQKIAEELEAFTRARLKIPGAAAPGAPVVRPSGKRKCGGCR